MFILTNDKLAHFEKCRHDVLPFWNPVCQKLSDELWLPEKKTLQKNTIQFDSVNYMTSFVRKTSHTAFPVSSQLDLEALAAAEAKKKKKTGRTRRKVALPDNVILATKKIRFYPKQTQDYYDMCSVFRRGYNIAVEYLNQSDVNIKSAVLCQCHHIDIKSKILCEENDTDIKSDVLCNSDDIDITSEMLEGIDIKSEILCQSPVVKQKMLCDLCGKYKSLRAHICAQVEAECKDIGRVYNCNVVQESVDSAKAEFAKVCSKNKALAKNPTGEKFSALKFKSSKETQQTFTLNKMPKLGHPCHQVLGKIRLTEKVPKEAIGQQVKVTVEFGRWYLLTQYHITLCSENQGRECIDVISGEKRNYVKCVALDPGVRNFMTGYSESEVFFAGQDMKKKLLPLALKARKLQSQKKKLENIGKQFGESFDEKPLWFQHRWQGLNKQLDRVKIKKENIIQTLHHELAHYLVNHYDVIFLPTYHTKKMSAKKSRNISKSTVVNMLALCHYQFKLMLKWYAKKYGKRVIDVSEAYTSKTDWLGHINENLKGADEIRSGTVLLDRDVNGARNIYIKQLSLLRSEGLPRRADFITMRAICVASVAK